MTQMLTLRMHSCLIVMGSRVESPQTLVRLHELSQGKDGIDRCEEPLNTYG